MQSCLVIKTSSLGDILQTIPSILILKKNYPDLFVSWVVEKKWASALENFSFIDELIITDFKTWKKQPLKSLKEIKRFKHALQKKTFDLALDFQGNTKSALILSLAKASVKRSFHSSQVAEWPHRLVKGERIMSDTSHVLNFNRSLIEDLVQDKAWGIPKLKKEEEVTLPKNRKIIMLGLGSMWPSKTFSDVQVQSLLEDLKNKYNPYFLIPALVSEKDRYLKLLGTHEGEILTKENLTSYVPYFLKTDLFIGVDSSLLHLARLFKVPSKAFFGPSSLKFYGSSNDIQGSCPYGETFLKRCKNLRKCHAPCMKGHNLFI